MDYFVAPPRFVRLSFTLALLSMVLSCHRQPLKQSADDGSERTRSITFAQQAVTVPPNFDATLIPNDGPNVPSPVAGPTKMAIAPDGRIFIAEHWGGVRIVKKVGTPPEEAVLPTAFLRLPAANVDTTGSRGLMGIALDPSFASNGRVYLHYTRKISSTVSRNRIVRVTASAANPDVAIVDGTGAPVETLLFEMTNQGSANAHNSMPMLFGADGKLWVTTGENNVGTNAQLTTHTGGKILRMNPDGSPVSDNPLFSSSNQVEKRLWAKGLRNPWTLARDPGTNRIFFNDVGSLEGGTPDPTNQPWEEANFVPLTTTGLLDYGWPNKEGIGPNIVYRYANGPGNDGDDCAIVGGTFYRSTGQYTFPPATYDGAFFFGDHCTGWIRYLPANQQTPTTGANSIPTNVAQPFSTNLGAALLDLQVHPDGSLYYIARATVVRDHDAPGVIGRIRPTAIPVPTVEITDPEDGAAFFAPASFTVLATAAPGGGTLTKVEFFSNSSKVGEDTTPPYEQLISGLTQGEYRLTAKAWNSLGQFKESIVVTVTVDGPTAEIQVPLTDDSVPFIAGQPVSFSGRATDPQDGLLPASSLEWFVLLHHNLHTHPAAGPFTGVDSGSFVPNPDDETDHDIYYGIYLTATDSAGLRHTTMRKVKPITRNLTLATAPLSNLQVYLDGSPHTAPYAFQSNAGMNRALEAPQCQTSGTTFYRFADWSNGVTTPAQIISSPTSDQTYTASYLSGPWVSADIGAVGVPGSYSAMGDVGASPTCKFTVSGSGVDIWNTADEFRFVHQPLTGNGSIVARVVSLSGTDPFAKAGVMMREGTAAGARNLFMFLTPTAANAYRFQRRLATNGITTREFAGSSVIPAWVKVERVSADTFRGYFSLDGTQWTKVGADVVVPAPALPANLNVGLAVTNHNDTALATGVFDNVSVTPASPPTAPNPPTNLVAADGVGQSVLTWNDNSNNEDGFKVERKLAADPVSAFMEVATAPANATATATFTNSSVPAGTYSYRVRAFNSVGNSIYSNTDDAVVTAPSGPPPPSNLSATIGGGNTANLTWTDNSSNETGFRVEKKVGTGSFTTLINLGVNANSHADPNLTPGTYTYRVIALGSPNSGPSNEVVVVIRNPEADAHVRDGTHADNNFGANTTIEAKNNATVGNNRQAFVRVNLADVAINVISAKLRIYGASVTSSKSIAVSAVSTTAWTEGTGTIAAPVTTSGIDWNSKPVIDSQLSSLTVTTTAGYWEFDVTSHIQAQKTAGASSASLAITMVSSSTETPTSFNTRENASNKPIIVISSRP